MNRRRTRSKPSGLRVDKKEPIEVTGKDVYYTVLNFFAWHFQIVKNSEENPVTLNCAHKNHLPSVLDEYDSELFKNPKNRDTDASWLGIRNGNRGIDIPNPKTLNECLSFETSAILEMDFLVTEDFPISIDMIHDEKICIILYYHRESDSKHVEQVAYNRDFYITELSFVESRDGDGTVEFSIRENDLAIVIKCETYDGDIYHVKSTHVAATPSTLMRTANFVV